MAWDIIRKGPERLQSQFAAGYGMVLNLLYSRSLQEAKAFIDRSFNSYLSERPLLPLSLCKQQAFGDLLCTASCMQLTALLQNLSHTNMQAIMRLP